MKLFITIFFEDALAHLSEFYCVSTLSLPNILSGYILGLL